MATLNRPGVSVTRTTTPASPTILDTQLKTCFVGPCYAILSPTTSTGALDSEAQVSTPAIIKSTSALGESLAVAGKYVALSVDGGSITLIKLPDVASGSNIDRSVISEAIMAKLSGISVKIDTNNKLVIASKTTGSTAQLTVHAHATMVANGVPGVPASSGDMAHAALFLTAYEDLPEKGQGGYKNKTYTIPYDLLPTRSFHPSGDELVFKGENIDVYRNWNGTLTKMGETSAINWNSFISNADKINNQAVAFAAPHTVTRKSLYAKNQAGSMTNRVFNAGTDASTTIALCADHAHYASTINYPDTTGTFYLYAEAKGMQDFLADQTANCGAYAGSVGNDLAVKFQHDAGGPDISIITESSKPVVLIKYTQNSSTYQAMSDQLTTQKSVWEGHFHSLTINFPAGKGIAKFDPHASGQLDGLKFFLSGGQDPVNFGADGGNLSALVQGSVRSDSSTNPVTLVQGKNLVITVDGGVEYTVPMPSGTKTTAQLVSDINGTSGLQDVVLAAEVTNYSRHADSTYTAQKALKLTAKTTTGHYSHIDISKSDPEVIKYLFAGFTATTETLANGSLDNGTLTVGTDYNLTADTPLEKAVKVGSVSLELDGLIVKGHCISGSTTVAGDGVTEYTLELSHSDYQPDETQAHAKVNNTTGAEGAPVQILFTPSSTSTADNVSALNSALANVSSAGDGTMDGWIVAVEVKLNDSDSATHMVLYDAKNVTTKFIKLYAANTTAAYKNALDNSGVTPIFDINLTTQETKITITDKVGSAATKLSGTATLSTAHNVPTGWSYLEEDATKVTRMEYDKGTMRYWMQDELFFTNTHTRKITYTRAAASVTSLDLKDYTSNIWSGQSTKVATGDRLFNNGTVMAAVTKVEDLKVNNQPATAGWGTGAVLVLSADAAAKDASYANWYISAENLASSGSRTVPEVIYDDNTQEATVKHGLNRGLDGIPASGSADVYAGFSALRLDVTAKAKTPGILLYNDITEVEASIGPVSTANPLAFAMYLGFLNSTTAPLRALGVSATSASEADGTTAAYLEALSYLEQHEVYAMAPLTQGVPTHQLINEHVTAMSATSGKKERIAFICPKLPTEEDPTLVVSSTTALATKQSSEVWNINFGESVNVPAALNGKTDANGNTISASVGSSFTAAQGVYLERSGDAFRYLVTSIVDASTVQIKTNYAFDDGSGPGTAGNDDVFYYDAEDKLLEFAAAGETATLFVRAKKIDTTTTAGKTKQCEALAAIAGGASGYKNSRLSLVQPESLAVTYDGVQVIVPGYYGAVALAAVCGSTNPSQPLTNYPLAGFDRPIGSSDKFTETQMATAAAGGVNWLIQDTKNGPLFSRHQLSTDLTDIKTRELSVTKAVDALSKKLRNAAKIFIGRNNITQGLLNQLGLVVTANMKGEIGTTVANAVLDSIAIDSTALDKIAIQCRVTPFYPANEIAFTIII